VRAVVQRVREARVSVGGRAVAEMQAGLLALVGVGHADGPGDAAELAHKLVHLRVFEDERGRMQHSLLDTGGTLGVVSQFTLLADTRKGRRPSFHEAAPGDRAEPLVAELASRAGALGVTVVTGRFGARMQVALVNDGPVTLLLESSGNP